LLIAAAAFESALRLLDAQPEDVVFVDDDAVNVAAAADLGMTAVRYESVGHVGAELKDLGLISGLAILE
jgi:FMN phosphatase YigB (HAD superfamily)